MPQIASAISSIGREQDQQVALHLDVDVVEDLDGDATLGERGAREMNDLAAERVARGEQEIREQERDAELADHAEHFGAIWSAIHCCKSAASAGGAGGAGRRLGGARRLGRRLVELRRRLAHVIDRPVGAAMLLVRGNAQLARGIGQLGDERRGVGAQQDSRFLRPPRSSTASTSAAPSARWTCRRSSMRDERLERVAQQRADD